MALPVDVSSIDVLRSAREALLLFTEDAQAALGATESEINRCVDWLTHDQRMYWQSEVKRRHEGLSEVKAELHRKQLSQTPGSAPRDSEQREAVRTAKRRLEEAEDKIELLKRWLPEVERAIMEYQGQARTFADLLEFDVDRSVEGLDRMIAALDDYVRTSAPETIPARLAASASPPAPSASKSPAAEPAAAPVAEEATTEDEQPQTEDER